MDLPLRSRVSRHCRTGCCQQAAQFAQPQVHRRLGLHADDHVSLLNPRAIFAGVWSWTETTRMVRSLGPSPIKLIPLMSVSTLLRHQLPRGSRIRRWCGRSKITTKRRRISLPMAPAISGCEVTPASVSEKSPMGFSNGNGPILSSFDAALQRAGTAAIGQGNRRRARPDVTVELHAAGAGMLPEEHGSAEAGVDQKSLFVISAGNRCRGFNGRKIIDVRKRKRGAFAVVLISSRVVKLNG
jgi:hypothetical protein